MKILSWNILHGGGKRAPDILDVIKKEQPDIVTLQEFRHGSSQEILLDGLAKLGLDEQFVPETTSARDNSLIIAAKYNFQAITFPKSGYWAPTIHKTNKSLIINMLKNTTNIITP